MLIVSKFHDYYDTALAHGIDKTCVYNRAVEQITATKDDSQALEGKGWCGLNAKKEWGREVEFLFQAVVGFAGHLYPLIFHTLSKVVPDLDNDSTFMYDAEACKAFLDDKFPETREYDNNKKYRWHWGFDLSDESLEEFFQPEKHKRFQRFFLEHKVPIFVVRKTWTGMVIETNPMLKEYKFQKVKDPYTAMQEVHMYLSGVIGMADRDMAEVGNDDRIKQRGFDKWSFRKEPTKKKRK